MIPGRFNTIITFLMLALRRRRTYEWSFLNEAIVHGALCIFMRHPRDYGIYGDWNDKKKI